MFGLLSQGHATSYWIKSTPQVTGPLTLQVKLTSNLPDGAWIGVTLSFTLLQPADPALAGKLYRVQLRNGQASVRMDERQATTTMPRGSYFVRTFYSPIWEENQAYETRHQIKRFVEVRPQVTLQGDGIEWRDLRRAMARFKTIDRSRDAIENWTLDRARRQYGRVQALPGRGFPEGGVKMYYSPAVDATWVVDAKDKLVELRGGRAFR